MTMPSFGLNNLMARNRGFVFVPAINDQVMVGFEHNDPERPFVIGAIPHGMNAAIDVADPEKEKHISVGSGSTLTFIEEIAKKEILLQVDPQNFVKISVPMGIGTITVQSSLDIMVKATAHITVDAPLIDITGQIINIKGTMVNIEGITTSIKGTAMLAAEGAITTVKGTGMLMAESSGLTTVKGGIVMIN
jgi:phage baseplate assembly protein gpV